MDFEDYNRSFEEIIENIDEEADYKLRSIRRQCVKNFVERLNVRQSEWDKTFHDLLRRSEEEVITESHKATKLNESNSLRLKSSATTLFTTDSLPIVLDLAQKGERYEPVLEKISPPPPAQTPAPIQQPFSSQSGQRNNNNNNNINSVSSRRETVSDDPHFSNFLLIKEFVRIQELLEQNRKIFADITANPSLKSYKNDLNLFIRTQINSISNNDAQHLETKTRLLTSLFLGERVNFQNRQIDASQHPQGQLFSMDLAAQTFVKVGARLVDSVPAIAKSMATVINGIVKNNLPIFKDLIIGHLQERCPYLVPMYPSTDDCLGNKDQEVRFKIACGYSFDSRTKSLESEEKFLIRMRSMVLVYACIMIQEHMRLSWTWLASFLSLKPQPVISATILQAFLQESSKKMSSIYGRQYDKILAFIKNNYVKMLEEATSKTSDKQSFVKLKNLLSDDSNLVATPDGGSIFRTVRLT